MKMKNLAIVLLFLVLLAVTTGCDRIASIPPIGAAATPTSSDAFPVGQAPDPTDVAVLLQTTVAKMATPKDGAPTSTPTPLPTGIPSATAVPTATPAPTSTSVPTTYALAQGEWAICVARRYNLNLDYFFAVNHINMNSRILPVGFVFNIPTSGGSWTNNYGPRAWHAHPGTYIVQPGDNINHIACFFGDLKPSEIEAANGLHGSYALNPGQALSIP